MDKMIILLSTCDRYSAAWAAFCHSFRKYWPDCPWPLRAITNYLDLPCGRAIKVGKDKGWSETTKRALKRLDASVVLLMLEDHWLTGPVDSDVLMDFAEHVKRGHADHIRLYDSKQPRAGDFQLDSRLFVFARGARYRACLQPAFWKVETLSDLLRPGESAWQFEQRSAKRTKGSEKFLCVKSNAHFPYALGGEWDRGPVVKGEWTEAAGRYAKREGLEIDFSRNPGDVK